MISLQSFVESQWASAIGWTLLHSLWEGALVAGMLATVMAATKSPRVRYAAGCLALLSLIAAFALTLWQLAPHARPHSHSVAAVPFPIWRQAAAATNHGGRFTFSTVAPWLAPCWLTGVFVLYLRHVLGLVSLSRLRRRGVCSAPEIWRQRLAVLSAQVRLTRPVLLVESALAHAPILIGHVRPLILVPVGLFTGNARVAGRNHSPPRTGSHTQA